MSLAEEEQRRLLRLNSTAEQLTIEGLRNATIEECARVVETIGPHKDTYSEITTAIRALKDKP